MGGIQELQRCAKSAPMIWQFLTELHKRIEKKKGAITKYHMAVHILEVKPQQYHRYVTKEARARSLPCEVLARARKNSGLSWKAFGELFDKYFLKGAP